jgi:Protein of unknown function (DUF3307)
MRPAGPPDTESTGPAGSWGLIPSTAHGNPTGDRNHGTGTTRKGRPMNAAGAGTPAAFAVLFIALYTGHLVGDHWVQTSREAARKALPGWPGRLMCAEHVATLTITKFLAVAVATLITGIHIAPWALAAALTVDAVSHYWADRRTTLAGLAGRLGKSEFYLLGSGSGTLGTGAYALDQSWHIGWLFAAALIASIGAS